MTANARGGPHVDVSVVDVGLSVGCATTQVPVSVHQCNVHVMCSRRVHATCATALTAAACVVRVEAVTVSDLRATAREYAH